MTLTKEELDLINKNVAKSMELAEQYQRIGLLLNNIQRYVKDTRHKLLRPASIELFNKNMTFTGEALEKMSESLDNLDDMIFMFAYSFDPIVAKHFSTTKAEEAKDAIL